MSEKDYLIAGLGNIGREYEDTRHNMGFMVLDAWAQASNAFFGTARYGDIAKISIKGRNFHLLKPSTYMNLSGNAVRYWMQELDLDTSHLLVVSDDINLPFGTTRLRGAGSDGGHNGLKNINELLGTTQYARIRVGVGHEFSEGAQVDYVLGKLSEEQKKDMERISKKVISGIVDWAFAGLQIAMNKVNA